MTYKVISASNHLRLSRLVGEAIKLGWKPQGGVSTIRYETKYYQQERFEFYQAMVLENET